MKKLIVIKLVLAIYFSLILVAMPTVAEAQHLPFTIDKSQDFKPLNVKGHENCYVKEIGKGVMVALHYATEGKMKDEIMAMELVLTPEAYKNYPKKIEGFEYFKELDAYVKHFYGHEVPHEMHMEHAGHKH